MFEIGNSLREARIRQGLELSHVELATKIRTKYLRAIEDEQFGLLPDEPYVKGFLHAYAEFLGLEGNLYVDEFTSRFVTGGFDDMPERRGEGPPRRRPRTHHAIERRMVLFALVGIAALAALVIAAWKYGGSNPSASTPAVLAPQSQAPTELQLTGLGRGTYVEVRRASRTGPVLLQATVPAGKVERLTGSTFWLYVKHPTGVQVLLGGRVVALPAIRNLKVLVGRDRTTRTH